VRAIIWLVALALILRVLGFDITAILAGLGISGLAIGLAAKDMIADIISALLRVRRENALWILGKIGLILVGALLLPRFILGMLTRLFGRGDPDSDSLGLLLSSLRAFVRAIIWLAALALILRVLGFDTWRSTTASASSSASPSPRRREDRPIRAMRRSAPSRRPSRRRIWSVYGRWVGSGRVRFVP
jgi:small-conductance mechanosensitive channel